MALVDDVWGRIEFRTPWSARPRARRPSRPPSPASSPGTARPGRSHRGRRSSRGLRAEVTLPDGEVVRLHGYADRLELDEDGRVVVVDLKTGKYPPDRERGASGTPSSGSTSSPSTTARPTSCSAARAAPGGAELVQLRNGDRAAQGPAPGAAGAGRRRRPPGRGAARCRRSRGAPRRGVRGPARATTASAARSSRSAPTRLPGRCSRERRRPGSPRPSSCSDVHRRATSRSATQQFAAITAPLEPAVVIAGAGSGKTTLMAARVVWLVAHRPGRAARVLGLTFTTKAAAELATGSATACAGPGCCPTRDRAAWRRRGRRSRSRRSRPTTPTPPPCSPSTACGSGTSPTPG